MNQIILANSKSFLPLSMVRNFLLFEPPSLWYPCYSSLDQ